MIEFQGKGCQGGSAMDWVEVGDAVNWVDGYSSVTAVATEFKEV